MSPRLKDPKRDNATLEHKVALRKRALDLLKADGLPPVIMETHGGKGGVWKRCYPMVKQGTVFEKDPKKVDVLAKQRPTWAVYEADCVTALREGAGTHLEYSLVDIDPYGGHWDALAAYLDSDRPFPPRWYAVINDGLKLAIQTGIAWKIDVMRPAVEHFGADLYPVYGEVCRWLWNRWATERGWRVEVLALLHAGVQGNMTHALLRWEKGGT